MWPKFVNIATHSYVIYQHHRFWFNGVPLTIHGNRDTFSKSWRILVQCAIPTSRLSKNWSVQCLGCSKYVYLNKTNVINRTRPFKAICCPQQILTTTPRQQHSILSYSKSTPNFSLVRKSRDRRGIVGGIVFLIHNVNGIIIRDFNAHHPLWHFDIRTDDRGNEIADQIIMQMQTAFC